MRGRSVIEADSLVAHERVGGPVHWWVERWERIGHRIDSVIEAGSLVDLLIEEVDFGLAIVAGSLVARERMTRSTGG